MTRSKRLLTYSLVLAAMALPALLGAVSSTGVIFLLIEPGSRPGGMAEAYVAQVDDAFAGFWNAGAMAFNRKTQFAGMHTNWFGDVDGIDDMYYEYLGWNQYFQDIGNIGMHIIYLTYGKQDRIDEQGVYLDTFTSYELAAAVSYASQIRERIGVGVTFKYILSDLAPEGTGSSEAGVKGRGMSWAVDLGLQIRGINLYYYDLPRLSFGLNIQNIGPNITYINESQADVLPLNWRMGFSYLVLGSLDKDAKDYNRFTINADMNKVLDDKSVNPISRIFTSWSDDAAKYEREETVFSLGAEYTYYNLLSLRAGHIWDKAGSIEGPSFGVGMQYTFSNRYKVNFDFAMQQAGELTDYNKTFSLGVEF